MCGLRARMGIGWTYRNWCAWHVGARVPGLAQGASHGTRVVDMSGCNRPGSLGLLQLSCDGQAPRRSERTAGERQR